MLRNAFGDYALLATQKLTAFGEGRRGAAQFDKNLNVTQNVINQSNLSSEAKTQLNQQIMDRTFETQLYLGEGSNPTKKQLDFLRDVTGKSVDKVVVLPSKGK